jgi:hypothetical protein
MVAQSKKLSLKLAWDPSQQKCSHHMLHEVHMMRQNVLGELHLLDQVETKRIYEELLKRGTATYSHAADME